jgi:hypothetical protein
VRIYEANVFYSRYAVPAGERTAGMPRNSEARRTTAPKFGLGASLGTLAGDNRVDLYRVLAFPMRLSLANGHRHVAAS